MLALLLALAGCTPAPTYCDLAPIGQVTLPADEAVHDESIEWWYWTGHLTDDQGRWYGFEETFFVFQMGVYDATMAHVAVTDIDADDFAFEYAHEEVIPQMSGEGFQLAVGADSATGVGGVDHLVGAAQTYGLDLTLTSNKPTVFQHGDGYQEYDIGGYTWYYSRERMSVSGVMTVDGEQRVVLGTGWMDHQWGQLAQMTAAGWDWFAIQLDDDREVMLFLTHGGGEVVGGSITGADCGTQELAAADIQVVSHDTWTSPHSDCTYPMGWTVTVLGETFELTPVRLDQELYNDRETYWEGANVVTGDATGRAYVELAGYCG